MKRTLAVFLALVLTLSLFTAVASAEGDTIKIGVFEPITGSYAGGGAMELEGFQLANELYPEVMGKKIELVVSDS